MAMNPRKVRLPELPIFRKFSLALRQEFGKPEEVLKALQESSKQIEAMIGEGGARLRPALRQGSASAFGSAGREEGRQGSEPAELSESPESFLKDSVAGSFRRLDSPEDSPPAADATRAMRPPKRLRPRPPRSSDSRGSSREAEPSSGQADVRDSGVRAKKAEPRQRPSKKATTPKRTGKRGAAAKTAGPAGDEGSTKSKGKSATPAEQAPSKVPAASKPEEEPAPAPAKGDSAPATQDDTDFWGDERPWGKSRRGKARSLAKEGSPSVRIVRIGDEGKPVNEKDGSADEGG